MGWYEVSVPLVVEGDDSGVEGFGGLHWRVSRLDRFDWRSGDSVLS